MEITNKEFDEFFQEKDHLLVVDFKAEWCQPCQVLLPIIEELIISYKDRATIIKVDVDNQSEIASKFGIRSIPTILFFKNGEIVDKKVGMSSKSQLEEMIEAHL